MDTIGNGPLDVTPPAPRTPRLPQLTDQLLLRLITLGVAVLIVLAAITAWNTYRTNAIQKDINCGYASLGQDGKPASYDDLDPASQVVVDALDCDIRGR